MEIPSREHYLDLERAAILKYKESLESLSGTRISRNDAAFAFIGVAIGKLNEPFRKDFEIRGGYTAEFQFRRDYVKNFLINNPELLQQDNWARAKVKSVDRLLV